MGFSKFRKQEVSYTIVTLELSETTKCLLEQLIGALGNERVLLAINNLDRKVTIMSSNIDRIEKEAADLAADVPVIKQALADLTTLVADLKAQIAQGQIDQARLDAAAATLEKVDDDLDSLTAPPAEG